MTARGDCYETLHLDNDYESDWAVKGTIKDLQVSNSSSTSTP